ncbi:MAG TPA: hypothetical protein VHD31_01155 [Candidatus Paceibacterota bacterium]|nr:hypothetical protein [Candidatus Paceibacterota bacterium]
MDPQVQASFIPKKPLTPERGAGGGAYGLIFLLALLVFITSVVAAGAAFLYKGYLNASLDSKKASLQKYQDAYDLPTIQALVRFDSRINEARTVLNRHIAPSGVFFFLAQQTLSKVQLTKMDYSLGTDGTATLVLDGVADSFSTIALQSDQFGASKALKNVIFSNIAIGENGQVTFHVAANVDPSLILYSKNLSLDTSALPPDSTPASSPSTPATSSTIQKQ